MNTNLTLNAHAVLMLTAPLMVGRAEYSPDLLSPEEYNRMAQALYQSRNEPSVLLGPKSDELIQKVHGTIDAERIKRLLDRGSLLDQAAERWRSLSIWVLAREDREYPQRTKGRLYGDAPAVIYGCGDKSIFFIGGLAIFGAKAADKKFIEYAESIGRLAAKTRKTVVSSGTPGVDQAATQCALQGGGSAISVLAGGLEEMAANTENNKYIANKQLILISADDPAADYSLDSAMNNNKVIYSLGDGALIVSSEYETGITWAGAIEQLEKFNAVPIYVKSQGKMGKSLETLVKKGAHLWPNPATSAELNKLLDATNVLE